MTCRQLGGACDLEFMANSYAEIAEMSKNHGMEMFQKNDKAHLKAMQEMRDRMVSPGSEAMKDWTKRKEAEFDALPDIA
ncbi:DUF1059 domain-containing protein [Zeaxanthinibacter enoshimensis]|nr:DUF1059 domain-containing protein [Zeaxanthinibacter enoshimensis]